jgi:tetratricopeptide (TPR) repeat protein
MDNKQPAYYDSSMSCYNQSLALAQKFNSKKGLALAYQGIGAICRLKGEKEKAIDYLQRSLSTAQEINSKEDIALACATLYETYLDKKDYFNALNYYRQRKEMLDSIFNDKKSGEFSELNIKYETEKKQKENELLKKTGLLKDEQLAAEETKKKFLYGVAGLIFALAIVLFIAFRNKQRANQLLSRQKDQITQQQKEIIDSIKYARRIQRSLLPPKKYIERNMKRLKKED